MQLRSSAAMVLLFLAACSHSLNQSPVITGAGARISINLNPGWKFIRHDIAGAQDLAFDDTSWQSIDLPHTWNALDGEDGGNNYYRGPGWYRRHLDLSDRGLAGKSLFLHFDAACSAAEVYVNGKLAGKHQGMFAAFCFDVTPLLNPVGDNILAVRVTNASDPAIPPLSADFTFFGGLYRGVTLLALNPLAISPLDDASSGVYIKQTNVSADHADLQITTKLQNAGIARSATVKCEVLDAQDQTVAAREVTSIIPPGGGAVVVPLQLLHPHLWQAREDPYLYQVRMTVTAESQLADQLVQPLGVRFFRTDPQLGFFLNGRSFPLHGVNRHQDRPDQGWAITPQQQKEDFDLIMEMGCNAVRLSHYQHAQEFYDWCDRGGLVVWAEACLVNSVAPSAAFDETCKQQLREMIKQNYNHPSICFWSLYNELNDGGPKPALAVQRKHQIELIKVMNDLAHQLDPDRLTTAASSRLEAKYPLNLITDDIAFNPYDGWYTRSVSDWPATLDKLHAATPQRSVGISEYGAGASVHQHEAFPKKPKPASRWHPEEWQATVHEAAYDAMKDRPWIWGTFLWCMFDFASDSRNEGDHPGINDKGLVTYDRKTKKDAFFFYKANWSSEPFVYLTDRRFTPRRAADVPVKIYSNCDTVEFKLNGQSNGSKTSTDHLFIWPVQLKQGQNELEAIATRSGERYTDRCTIVYDPAAPTSAP